MGSAVAHSEEQKELKAQYIKNAQYLTMLMSKLAIFYTANQTKYPAAKFQELRDQLGKMYQDVIRLEKDVGSV